MSHKSHERQVSDGDLMDLMWALVCPGENLDAVEAEGKSLGSTPGPDDHPSNLWQSFNLSGP